MGPTQESLGAGGGDGTIEDQGDAIGQFGSGEPRCLRSLAKGEEEGLTGFFLKELKPLPGAFEQDGSPDRVEANLLDEDIERRERNGAVIRLLKLGEPLDQGAPEDKPGTLVLGNDGVLSLPL